LVVASDNRLSVVIMTKILTTLSLSAFARSHAVSPQAASKWKLRGLLVMEAEKVVVEESDARLSVACLGRFASTEKMRVLAPVKSIASGRLERALDALRAADAAYLAEVRAGQKAWFEFPAKFGPRLSRKLGIEHSLVFAALTECVSRQLLEFEAAQLDQTDQCS
jgi:hypothetical protein